MTLRYKFAAVAVVAMSITMFTVACGGDDTASIIQTETARSRAANDATARAGTIAAGGNPDAPGRVAEGGAADRARQAFNATQTAIAEGGGATATPTPEDTEITAPEGPALTDADDPTVDIQDNAFVPNIIKVQVGTTVTWTKDGRSASSVKSLEGQAEEFNSGALSKGPFDQGPKTFTHTFTVPGCHEYGSFYSGETSRGAVCVVE